MADEMHTQTRLDRLRHLPTQEQWKEIKANIEARGMKIIMLDSTCWANTITRRKETVTNMPIFARLDDSDRPMAVLKIRHMTRAGNDPSKPLQTTEEFVFNEYYSHTNFSPSLGQACVVNKQTLDGIYLDQYEIIGQNICSPITRHHFWTNSEKTIRLLFKGQLMGQQGNSAYQTVAEIHNAYREKAIYYNGTSTVIKRNASILELLLKMSPAQIRETTDLRSKIDELDLPTNSNTALVKLFDSQCYTPAAVSNIEEGGCLYEDLSDYYPVISYKQIQEITSQLPNIELDVACMGLGSAGSNILEQLCKSTHINSYMLCDMDTVEAKNLRNQWYRTTDKSVSKTTASRTHVAELNVSLDPNASATIQIFNGKFQDKDWTSYEFKYVISGFDSIEARYDLFNFVKEGKLKTKYIIDARYDGLESSLYFVDVSDNKQMEYYERTLKDDLEALHEIKEKEKNKCIDTWDEFYRYLKINRAFQCHCSYLSNKFFNRTRPQYADMPDDAYKELDSKGDVFCTVHAIDVHNCECAECLEYWKKAWELNKDTIKIPKTEVQGEVESTCVRHNFIDIYKFTSSYVFAAVRCIEDEEPKPFTHIEATTEGFPTAMMLRK